MQTILVTGSSGGLGGKLVKFLLESTEYDVLAAASSEEKLNEMVSKEDIEKTDRLSFIANDELTSESSFLPDLYGAIHLAFSRRNQPASRIADSVVFSSNVFKKLAASNVEKVINVSSQGVYGATEEIRTENTPAAPGNQYTMAKYAAEVIFNTIFRGCGNKMYTNLRLDIVAQSNNLIQALCKQAREGTIHLRGGEQVFSFIDENDAVRAVLAMLDSGEPWEREYNVGWDHFRLKLTEVADIVADSAERFGYTRPSIVLERQDIQLWAGMDSTRFQAHTLWNPEITLNESIAKMIINM